MSLLSRIKEYQFDTDPRYEVWSFAFGGIKKHWLFGSGKESFVTYFFETPTSE